MEQHILGEVENIIDHYFRAPDLNQLLKTFARDKANENKKFWSDLTICCYYMLNGQASSMDKAAAHTELIILTLDIVDDLQDQDNHGKPWIQCNPAFTLNAILAFLTASFGEISKLNRRQSAKVFELLAKSIDGQQLDLNDSIRTESDYMKMIQHKSSTLIHFALCMGYIYLDDVDPQIIGQIDQLAQYIGVAAQIKNDIHGVRNLDFRSDILQKKRTLPVLYLLDRVELQSSPIHRYYQNIITSEEIITLSAECEQSIEQSGCIEYARTIQYLYAGKTEELIDHLPFESPWKDRLKQTVLRAIG